MGNSLNIKFYILKGLYLIGSLLTINLFFYLLLAAFSPVFRKVNEIKNFKDKEYDLLIFGNSAGLDGIDASLLSKKGLKSYNFCIGGSHIKSSVILLQNYLNANKRPKKVLLCLTSSMEGTFLKKYPFIDPCINHFYNKNILERYLTIYLKEFEWLYIEILKMLVSKQHREAKMEDGQWQIKKTMTDETTFSEIPLININYNSNYLDYFVSFVKKNALELNVIEMPGWRKHRNTLPVEYELVTRSGKVINIENLNNLSIADSLLNPRTDWLSLNHLNQFGAIKLTEYLHKKHFKN